MQNQQFSISLSLYLYYNQGKKLCTLYPYFISYWKELSLPWKLETLEKNLSTVGSAIYIKGTKSYSTLCLFNYCYFHITTRSKKDAIFHSYMIMLPLILIMQKIKYNTKNTYLIGRMPLPAPSLKPLFRFPLIWWYDFQIWSLSWCDILNVRWKVA